MALEPELRREGILLGFDWGISQLADEGIPWEHVEAQLLGAAAEFEIEIQPDEWAAWIANYPQHLIGATQAI